MFWDKVAVVYDLFADIYNGKVNRVMCRIVSKQIHSDDCVLECACGTGLITSVIAPKCKEVVATDFSEGMLKQTEKKCRNYSNVQVEFADITNLQYPDASFDAVIAANVIHLLDNPGKALSELNRVCKKDGKIIIPTYVNKEKTGETGTFVKTIGKAGADFKRQFTFSNYKDFFEKEGFTDIEIHRIPGRIPCAVAIINKKTI
ncbi:MAG: methyltransferase domain-containing protein [Faecalicoccus sp.]|nr:methyltransferase domain-containing protein [Faecalicoccus sp.]